MSNASERIITDDELKMKWTTKRLDANSLYLAAPKEIEACMTVPAEIGGKKILVIGPGAFSPRKNFSLSNKKREQLKEVKRVILSEGIEAIDDSAFWGCTGLEAVELPETLTELGSEVFALCDNLREVRLPAAVKALSYRTFLFCYKLENDPLSEEQLQKFGYAAVENSGLFPCYLEQIKRGKTDHNPTVYSMLARYVKQYKDQLIELILSGNDTAVRAILCAYDKLTLERLDECIALAQKNDIVNIISLLMQIKHERFSADAIQAQGDGKAGLAERTEKEWKEIFRFSKKDGVITVSGYKGVASDVTIPGEIGGFPVAVIKDKAFRRQNDTVHLETVTVSEGVETIGQKAFANQYSLTAVHLPASVTGIAQNAFYDEDDGSRLSRIIIHAPEGSYAETYAKENNIPFVAE